MDLFARYRLPQFSDKVRVSLQLNVQNVQESGRLQSVAVDPTGAATIYRIIDPRVFRITATFDL